MKVKKYIIIAMLSLFLTACSSEDSKNTEIESNKTSKMDGNASSANDTTPAGEVTDDTYSYTPNGDTPKLLKDVILNDAEFCWVYEDSATGENSYNKEMTLSKYNYNELNFSDNPVELGDYRVVDLDGDGYNEVIIDIPPGMALILHYEAEHVYGFAYSWRGIASISYAGVMTGSSGASYTSYSIMSLDKSSYQVQDIAVQNGDKYYVEGKETSEDDYLKYRNGNRFKGEVPYWTDFELLMYTR